MRSIAARSSRHAALALVACMATACVGLTPQLHPTDVEALEQLEDRDEREQAYIDNAIIRINDARGSRYTKGQRVGARPRGWQSLDLILRSDRNSAAALPEKKLRAARVLTSFMIASALVTVGGIASSAREGLDLSRPTGTSAVLIGGAASSLAFAVSAGVVWGQARKGYEQAVDVYNDSLALRLGISDADGAYRPPEGVMVDEEGFIILEEPELGPNAMPGGTGTGTGTGPVLEPKPPPPAEPPAEGPSEPPSDTPGDAASETASETPEVEPAPEQHGSLVGPARHHREAREHVPAVP